MEKFFSIIPPTGLWVYAALFLLPFLECSAFIGMFIPGETMVVLAGFLAAHGYVHLGDCIWVAASGAVLGDLTGYCLGRRIGRGYFDSHDKLLFLKKEHIDRAEIFFREHGGKAVFFGRFTAFLRAVTPFTAGLSRMRFGHFLIFNASGGILWSTLFLFLGYVFGNTWKEAELWSGVATTILLILVIAAVTFTERKRIVFFFHKLEQIINKYPTLNGPFRKLKRNRYIVIGLLAAIVLLWILGGITEDVMEKDPIVKIDYWVLSHTVDIQNPELTRFMLIITNLGGPVLIVTGSIIFFFYLLIRKRGIWARFFLLIMIGGSILDFTLKNSIQRARPVSPSGIALTHAAGWSYPSGHAMISTLFYLSLAYFLIRNSRSKRIKIATFLIFGLLIIMIAISRIYLEVHYLSDILAGLTGGLLWSVICLVLMEIKNRKL